MSVSCSWLLTITTPCSETFPWQTVKIDINAGTANILETLTKHPVATRLSLSGTLVVARDIAHAKLKERIDRGEGLPQYIKDFPVYYAGESRANLSSA